MGDSTPVLASIQSAPVVFPVVINEATTGSDPSYRSATSNSSAHLVPLRVTWNSLAEPRRLPHIRAELWWFLVATFFSLMTTISVVLTVLWYQNHTQATWEMHQVYKAAINGFNETSSSSVDLLARRVLGQLVHRAQERIEDYLKMPERIVAMNVASMTKGMHMFRLSNVSRTLETLWLQLRETPGVSHISYADHRGVFVAYGRMPDNTYTAEYRPPDNFLTQASVCPALCPPMREMQQGFKGDYSVSRSSGKVVQRLDIQRYDPRRTAWYQLASEARGRAAWTKPLLYSDMESIGMDFVQAFQRGEQTVAVFDASVSMRFLSQFLIDFHHSLHHAEYEHRDAVTFIVDRDGLMVASSRGIEHVTVGTTHGKRRRAWLEVPGLSVRAALQQLNATGLALPLPTKAFFRHKTGEGKFPSITIMHEGGPYLCSYGILTFSGVKFALAANDWIIVSIVRKKVYLSSVESTLHEVSKRVESEHKAASVNLAERAETTTFLCVAATLLGGCLMAFVARAITMPIRRISKEMRSIAELEFMQKEPLEQEAPMESSWRSKAKKRRHHTIDSGGSCSSTGSAESEAPSEPRCKPCRLRVKEIIEMRDAFASMSSGLQSFAKYVDPHVVELLLRSRKQAELGVQKADVTIFFSDIANFTTMGELLEPQTFMDLLSEYLEEMSTIIMEHQGVVGEFIGDGIMAWWNSPRDIGELHAARALTAALEQQRRLAELRRHWCLQGIPSVRVRMGLTRGTVHAGNVGSRRRMKFGLIGDSVNLAARLEALCKRYGVEVLVDGSVYKAPGVAAGFIFRPVDLVFVKGRSSTTELFEVVASRAAPGTRSDVGSFVDDFTEIHSLYRVGKFKEALAAVCLYQARWPEDKPAQMMRERCETLVAHPPGPGWTPVESLL